MVRQVNKAKISITIDHELYEIIQREADKDDRSVSSMINKILKDWSKGVSDTEGE